MKHNILKTDRFLIDLSAFWVETAVQTIESRGRFDVALSGGRTPERLYRLIARSPRMKPYWTNVHLWFSDERCVPPDSDQSNYKMVRKTLVDQVDGVNVYRMEGELAPEEAANRYADLLSRINMEDSMPMLDLIMLGVGADGHVASLFPGSENYIEQTKSVSAAYIDIVDMWRISMTLPLLQSARKIVVMVSGTEKADIMAKLFSGEAETLPVARIAHLPQTLWYLDEAAAANIPIERVAELTS